MDSCLKDERKYLSFTKKNKANKSFESVNRHIQKIILLTAPQTKQIKCSCFFLSLAAALSTSFLLLPLHKFVLRCTVYCIVEGDKEAGRGG